MKTLKEILKDYLDIEVKDEDAEFVQVTLDSCLNLIKATNGLAEKLKNDKD